MRGYSCVSPRFWTGDTGRALRAAGPEAQIVAFYLITCPSSNMIGLYYLPLPVLSYETGLTLQGARKGLARASEGGFAFYSEATETVWVPEMARFQIGETMKPADNKRLAVYREAVSYKKSEFYAAFHDRYNEAFQLGLPSPSEAPLKPLRSPSEAPLVQEQEQEREQEQGTLPLRGSPEGAVGEVAAPAATRGRESLASPRNGKAAPSADRLREIEIRWRIDECWAIHLEARSNFYFAINGARPSVQPGFDPKLIGEHIRRSLLLYDKELLGADQREEWKRKSLTRAAGIGLFHDPWCSGTGPDCKPGRRFLDSWRPWKVIDGKDPVPRFAQHFFEIRDTAEVAQQYRRSRDPREGMPHGPA